MIVCLLANNNNNLMLLHGYYYQLDYNIIIVVAVVDCRVEVEMAIYFEVRSRMATLLLAGRIAT